MANPFLTQDFHIRWSTLTPDHIEADIRAALQQAQANLDALIDQDRGKLSFESVVLGLDETTRGLNEAWGLVTHLDSLCNAPALREAHNKMLAEVSAFFAKIPLNEHLWDLLVTYSKTDEARKLAGVRKRALDEAMEGFIQAGADLPPEKKKRVEEIESELSQLTQKYSENVLDSTNKWELIIEDADKLRGLPPSAIDAARADAAAKGLGTAEKPVWRFTLKAPSMIPVMEYLEDEGIRRQVWEGSCSIGRGGEHDNTDLVWKILRLRNEKAKIMDKANFADHVLAHRMAKTGRSALRFIEDLHSRVREAFERETIELQEYRADTAHQATDLFQPWEVAFWAEKQRKAKYDFDEEELRPYFPLDKVLSGMFQLAEKVFDLRITSREVVHVGPGQEAPANVSAQPGKQGPVEVWHPQVKFFEVRNEKDVHIGSFYADWHPRDSKRGGAWMNYLKMGVPPSGERDRRLHLGLICGNMTPPVDGKPALLTHDEVCTVFHEFGHLLHQLCGNVAIPALNGVSVYWDFVELPSQLMENFCWERESLDLFARHHETGEVIPARLFKKMLAAKNYRSASDIMRQLAFGKLDLELHMHHATDEGADIDKLARSLLKDYLMPLKTEQPTMARRFGHLFSSPVGYAAGYYSYKWAEVLDADAFTRFQKEGVLNPAVGREFRDTILSKGNSEDPAKLFQDFMGRDPDAMALLVRAGLA
ncbi:MAG: M3 family metallopeptidase [Prosthecobacter sp.]|jgi:oligopeptidase A|uniref:M3 family metallopeptidase n=1 Tax=Prosthecobacter sp. TaxID=1965333 RepID=UPI0019E29B73|nr:M3 family metallopeptidase [Prosthecobacter sp.]MBE2285918.1 M3 family metallopeptidase [Prosthecobacter sp.]